MRWHVARRASKHCGNTKRNRATICVRLRKRHLHHTRRRCVLLHRNSLARSEPIAEEEKPDPAAAQAEPTDLTQSQSISRSDSGALFIIYKRQKSIAPSARDLEYFMQDGAGEHYRPSRRRFVAARIVFREADLPTIKISIQVN